MRSLMTWAAGIIYLVHGLAALGALTETSEILGYGAPPYAGAAVAIAFALTGFISGSLCLAVGHIVDNLEIVNLNLQSLRDELAERDRVG